MSLLTLFPDAGNETRPTLEESMEAIGERMVGEVISVAIGAADPHCWEGKPVGKRPLKRGITRSLRNVPC